MRQDQPTAERKQRGAFFTPRSIAGYLARWAVADDPSARVLDPTCGESVFRVGAGRSPPARGGFLLDPYAGSARRAIAIHGCRHRQPTVREISGALRGKPPKISRRGLTAGRAAYRAGLLLGVCPGACLRLLEAYRTPGNGVAGRASDGWLRRASASVAAGAVRSGASCLLRHPSIRGRARKGGPVRRPRQRRM